MKKEPWEIYNPPKKPNKLPLLDKYARLAIEEFIVDNNCGCIRGISDEDFEYIEILAGKLREEENNRLKGKR